MFKNLKYIHPTNSLFHIDSNIRNARCFLHIRDKRLHRCSFNWWYAQCCHNHHQLFSDLESSICHYFIIGFKHGHKATVPHNKFICCPSSICGRHILNSTVWCNSNQRFKCVVMLVLTSHRCCQIQTTLCFCEALKAINYAPYLCVQFPETTWQAFIYVTSAWPNNRRRKFFRQQFNPCGNDATGSAAWYLKPEIEIFC